MPLAATYHPFHPLSELVETSDKGPQTFIFSLFYDQQAGRGTFMPLSPNKVVNKQLAQLFKGTY